MFLQWNAPCHPLRPPIRSALFSRSMQGRQTFPAGTYHWCHAACAELALRILQVYEGPISSSVVVVVLSGDPEVPAMDSFTMEGSASDLKSLISSPAFLEVTSLVLSCKSSHVHNSSSRTAHTRFYDHNAAAGRSKKHACFHDRMQDWRSPHLYKSKVTLACHMSAELLVTILHCAICRL